MVWNELNMDKTKFLVIAHLRCPVDNWTVRKRSMKIFWDDGGLCGVLKEQITIIIFAFKVRGKIILVLKICIRDSLSMLNYCHTADKWASLLYSSNCLAKRHISLCQGCWLFGSSKSWSSNVCAALVSGLAMRSMVNKQVNGEQTSSCILMMGIWTDCRGCIIIIFPYLWFCLERVAWIHFCQLFWFSFSGTCALCWRSSNLLSLSCLGMIIFICTFPWTSMFLSTSTSCHSEKTLLW